MSLLKIGKMIFDMTKIDLIDLQYQANRLDPTPPLVRIQFSNRRDETQLVGGLVKHIKHGVVELPPDLSEIFRWFVDEIGGQLGILDVEKVYAQKDEFAAQKARLLAGKLPVPKGVSPPLTE